METKVKDRQWLGDIALVTSGSMEAACALAEANGIALTDYLEDGMTLVTAPVTDPSVTAAYEEAGIEPATALTDDDKALLQEGINFMGIEIDFIVS